MRTKIVAGNWKMNKTFEEGVSLVKNVLNLLEKNPVSKDKNIKIIFSPPFILLKTIQDLITGNPAVFTAAQNCHSEEKGAFTGEVSAAMISSVGAKYTIVGHSERRTYFGEKDAIIARKIALLLANSLIPVYCCGERIDERKMEKHFEIVKQQVNEALFHLTPEDFSKIVIAYEPVWAIGTGLNATPRQAQEMHQYIRTLISEKYGNDVAENTTILYGGSCNAKNAKELFANPDVDGGLIGGASLIADDFVQIIHSV